MPFASVALAFFLNNQDALSRVSQRATAPGAVDVAKMQTSVVDLSRGIVTCYHRSARFQQVDVVASPWDRQAQYGAENAAVFRIGYAGMSGMPYVMHVAVMARGAAVRTAVLADTAIIPANKKCTLEEWASAE